MKIGIDVRCLMNRQYSGVSWYTFNLLRALFSLDQKNQYLLFYNSSKMVTLPDFNYINVDWYGYRFPNKLFNFSLNFFHQPQLDKLLGGCDIFFSPNLHFISLSSSCRYLLTVHDLSFLLYPNFFTFKQRFWHWLILKNKILDKATLIISDSYNTKNDLINLLKIPSEKIKVCWLGVNNNYQPIKDPTELTRVKNKYHLPDNFILSLGSLEPRKNLISVIKVFNQINLPVNLVIAGAAGWKNQKINRLIKNNSKIKLLDYIAEEDKPALYNLSKILVYPSFYEGFGLPILEAMACGTPVIAGANSAQGEVLADAGLLVDPDNINQLRQAIDLLLNDSILRQIFIARGLERVKNFTWENTAQQFLQIIESFK